MIDASDFPVLVSKFNQHDVKESSLKNAKMEERFSKLAEAVN